MLTVLPYSWEIPTASLHFGLLGPLEVLQGGRPVEVGRPKQRAVLATLLVHANEVVSVDRFADLLWQDGGAGRSTGSLPVYIANLRRLLEPERPARTPAERILTLAPGYLLRVASGEYDAADFERLAAQGSRHLAEGRPRAARTALGEALSLWRGRAMEEFAFAELEADRLEGARLAAVHDRLVADLALGAHGAVVSELEHLVREQPLDERPVELLMLALYRSGRQGDALRAYSEARVRLGEALGVDPGPDLRRLEADILAHSPALDWRPPPPETAPAQLVVPAATPGVARPDVFVGRAGELAVLEEALTSSGNIVLVSGEPGIGKTRLVQEATARVAGRGCVVAWGRCEEGGLAPPFWPWIQAIRSILANADAGAVRAALGADGAEIGQLVPELEGIVELPALPPLDPRSARFRLFEAVSGFLIRLSQQHPVAVVLDDVHWSDPPSLQLIAHLARRLPGSNVCLVATYRDVDPAPESPLTDILDILARLPGRVELPLRGWTREEVAQYVAHEAGSDAVTRILSAIWDRAGGNPFFVGELTRLLVAEKAPASQWGTSASVPSAVRQVVGRRLARLPRATRELLTVAAVAGSDFDLTVVARAAGLELDWALDLIDVAVAGGVVKERRDAVERFQFTHALVQETIYEALAQLRRARLHGLIADALEQAGGDGTHAAEVAHHLYKAVPVCGPVRAIAAAAQASAAAQAALAHEVAEDHLRRGLALVATMPAGPERDRHELDLQVQLATLLSVGKGIGAPESAQAWQRATELCQAVEDRRRLLQSIWGLLTFAWASGDMRGARALAEHMLELRRTTSDPAVTVTAHLALGLVDLCCGEVAEGAAELVEAKQVADAVPEDALTEATFGDLRVQVDCWLGLARDLQGRHEEGRRLLDAAVCRARAIGNAMTIATGLTFALCSRVLSGEVDDVQLLADELIDQAERVRLADFTYHGRVVGVWALARQESARDEVLELLHSLPSAVGAGIRPWHPFWLVLTAEAWQRLGDLDEARRLVEEAASEIDAMGASFFLAEVHRLRAELLASMEPERHVEALARLCDAAQLADEQGATMFRDRALAAAGRVAGVGTGDLCPNGDDAGRRRDPPPSGPAVVGGEGGI